MEEHQKRTLFHVSSHTRLSQEFELGPTLSQPLRQAASAIGGDVPGTETVQGAAWGHETGFCSRPVSPNPGGGRLSPVVTRHPAGEQEP